jgi:hypothetical protein
MKTQFQHFTDVLDARFASIDQRFESVDRRLEDVDRRFDRTQNLILGLGGIVIAIFLGFATFFSVLILDNEEDIEVLRRQRIEAQAAAQARPSGAAPRPSDTTAARP